MSSLVIKLIKQDPLEIPRLLVKSILFFLGGARQEEEYFTRRAKLAHFLARVGLYEKKHLTALKQLVSTGDNVLDIGANFGVYTKNLSALVGENGKVYAFEPVSYVFKALKEITSDCKNVEYHNIGISDGKNEQAEIKMPLLFGKIPEPALSTLTDIEGKYVTEKIKLIKLDDMLNQLPKIKFIKVDIEGHEKEFFEGARELIKRDRPVIQFEADKLNNLSDFIFDLCLECNYKVAYYKQGGFNKLHVVSKNGELNLYLLTL